MPLTCGICEMPMRQAFTSTVLQKYTVAYFYCDSCGFLRSEQPYWLDEAYRDPITAFDTGIVTRGVNTADRLTSLLYFGLHERGQGAWLDYAGGFGILTRLMRDRGFDFYWQDKYTQNLFARGFEHPPGRQYRGVTAVEVLEHTIDPVAFVDQVFKDTGAEILLFTTVLFSGEPPPLDWWYYAFRDGQHISFFQRRTLQFMGDRLGLHLYSARSLHCFSKKKIRSFSRSIKLLTGYVRVGLVPLVQLRLDSKTMLDRERLTKVRIPKSYV